MAGIRRTSEANAMTGNSHLLFLEKHVVVHYNQSEHSGVVKFVGTTSFSPGMWVGIELKEPDGKNNGTVLGTTYFKCQEKHGVFIRPQCVLASAEGDGNHQQPPSTVRKIKDLDNSCFESADQDQLASVKKRMTHFEQFVAESFDELKEHNINSKNTQAVLREQVENVSNALSENALENKLYLESMENRFECIVALISGNANKHAKEIDVAKEKLGDLSKAILGGGKLDQLASIEERMSSLESSLAESADELKQYQIAHREHEEKMESLQELIGHNECKHAKKFKAVDEKLGDLDKAIVDCDKHDKLATITKLSVDCYNKSDADSVTTRLDEAEAMREEHEESMKMRLESLEALIEYNADKHADEIAVAKRELGDCARHDQLARVEALLNGQFGLLDNVVQDLQRGLVDQQVAHGEGKESIEARFGSLETLIGNNAQKFAKDVKVAHKKLGDLSKQFLDYAKHDQLASVEERINSLEKVVSESVGTHLKSPEMLASVDERIRTFGESTRSRLGTLEASRDKAIVDGTRYGQSARVEEHINGFDNVVEESVTIRLDEEVEALRDEHEESMKSRLESLEALIEYNENKHAEKFEVVNKKVEVVREEADAMREEHEESMKIRLESLEALIEYNQSKHAEKFEVVNKKLGDLDNANIDVAKIDQLARRRSSLEKFERMSSLEQSISEAADELKKCKAAPRQLHETLGICLESVQTLVEHADGFAVAKLEGERVTSMETRLESLEAVVKNIGDTRAAEIEAVNEKLGGLDNASERLASVEEQINSFDKFVGKSLQALEALLAMAGQSNSRLQNKDVDESSTDTRDDVNDLREELRHLSLDRRETIVKTDLESLERARFFETIRQNDEDNYKRQLEFEECESPSKVFGMLFQELQGLHGESKDPPEAAKTLLEETLGSPPEAKSPFEHAALPKLDLALLKTLPYESIGSQPNAESHSSEDDSHSSEDDSGALLEETLSRPPEAKSQSKHAAKVESQSEDDSQSSEDDSQSLEETPGSIPRAQSQSGHEADIGIDTLEWFPAHEVDNISLILGTWVYKAGTFSINQSSSKLLFTQHDFTGGIEVNGDWFHVHIPLAKGRIRMQIDRTGNLIRVQFKRNNASCWRCEVLAEKLKDWH